MGLLDANPPTVSIFVPVYNCPHYLPSALESLLAQTFTSFEILVADDGSTDDTRVVASAFAAKDPRIRVLALPHAGEVAARNSAVRAARVGSKYLMNHDADDISLPDKLQKLVCYLDTHPEVAVVGCFGEYFDDAGAFLGSVRPEWQPDRIQRRFGRSNQMINSAVLIRREVFDAIGGYREEFRTVDDYDFFARALLHGFVLANLPETLHRIRLHPMSIGSRQSARQQSLARRIQIDYNRRALSRPERALEWFRLLLGR